MHRIIFILITFNFMHAMGNTPLHRAVKEGNSDKVRALLKADALLIKNNRGETPIDLIWGRHTIEVCFELNCSQEIKELLVKRAYALFKRANPNSVPTFCDVFIYTAGNGYEKTGEYVLKYASEGNLLIDDQLQEEISKFYLCPSPCQRQDKGVFERSFSRWGKKVMFNLFMLEKKLKKQFVIDHNVWISMITFILGECLMKTIELPKITKGTS